MRIIKSQLFHFMEQGVIEGREVLHYRKNFGETSEIYLNREAAKSIEKKVSYEVYSCGEKNTALMGALLWGLTILTPETVAGECNMTRGHFHENADCDEFYFGISGSGILLLMDRHGNTWGEEISPSSLHYIKGCFAHRLVNTGEENLKVGACWPAVAGHDYESVEKTPFGYRIFKENNTIIFKGEENGL